MWENYRRKSGDGLSMTFLVIWLAGDVFNLLGVIMQDLLVTMVMKIFSSGCYGNLFLYCSLFWPYITL